MKKIINNIPTRILASLVVIGLLATYTATSGVTPVPLIVISLLAVALNIYSFMPKMLNVIIIIALQSIFLGGLAYGLALSASPNNEIIFAVATVILMSAIAYGYHKFASGKLVTNLLITYLIIDAGVFLSFQSTNADANYIFAMYIIALIFSVIPIVIKTVILNKKYPEFNVVSKANSILSKKVTNIFKAEKIKTFSKSSNSITRYAMVGDRILFLHEPASVLESSLTSNGLFYGDEDYSSTLEAFIKQSMFEANTHKINKNLIMPIVILNKYKDNKVGHVDIKSPKKPDTIIGSAYVCSVEGLDRLIKSIKVNNPDAKKAKKLEESFKKLTS